MMKSRKKKQNDPDLAVYQGHQLILAKDLEVRAKLGEGQYGEVQLGLWKPQNGTEEKLVAIKSLKNADFDGGLQNFLEEAQTMQKLSHENIVKMYGISLPFNEEPLKLVTELASYGSLEHNLKDKVADVCRVSTLSKFAVQVAEGMNYLASKNYVHRDLAARNILVFKPDLVKISDFGLARTLEGRNAKKISANRKMAIAWLPPETLRDGLFTPKSDVWSYGITLWEMFSFGKQPYAQHPLEKIKRMIVNGQAINRLGKPKACPYGFYEIMLKCWEFDPEKRPTFEDIICKLSQLQPKEGITRVSHFTGEEEHLSYNCNVKVTVISKRQGDMVLVQSEYGHDHIGLVEEKNLDFSKKALQKWAGGRINPVQISQPFDIKKLPLAETMAMLRMNVNPSLAKKAVVEEGEEEKSLTQIEEKREVRDLFDLGDVKNDPTKPLIPERHPRGSSEDHKQIPQASTGSHVAQATTGNQVLEQQVSPGTTGSQIAAQNEGGDVAILKDTAKPQHLIKQLHPHRPPRTQSESGTIRQGSKDDTAAEFGSKGTEGFTETYPPNIPCRPIEEKQFVVPGAVGRSATLSTKRKPVPTPRNLRPLVALKGEESHLGNYENFPTRSIMESIENPDTQSVVGESAKRAAPCQVPLPCHSAKRSPEEQENDAAKAKPIYDKPIQLPEPPVISEEILNQPPPLPEKHFGGTLGRSLDTSYQSPVGFFGDGEFNSAFLPVYPVPQPVNLETQAVNLVSKPVGPVTQPVYPVPAQPVNLETKAFNLVSKPVGQATQPVYPVPKSVNLETQAVNLVSKPVGPVTQPVYPVPQPVNLETQAVNLLSKPVGPVAQAVYPVPQPVNLETQAVNLVSKPVGAVAQPVSPAPQAATHEGAYGEEIDSGIKKIRAICGEELSRDYCYAFLLQYQGDIDLVARVIMTQKLSKLTGKTEPFCERTLNHCSWDLDRAALYIFENFEGKDV